MQQIRMFPDTGHVENDINVWLDENPNIKIVNINRTPMYDLYQNSPIEVCNQWIDTVVIYTKI